MERTTAEKMASNASRRVSLAQELRAGALQLLGEEGGEGAHEQERGEVRRHLDGETAGRNGQAVHVGDRALEEPALHAPGEQAEGDGRGGGAQGRAAAAEADGAAHHRERVEHGEDALGASGEVDEAGGGDHVRADLQVGHVAQVPPRPEEEGAHQRGEIDQPDDAEEERLDGAGKGLAPERQPGRGTQERGADQEPHAGEQHQLAVEPGFRTVADRRMRARPGHGLLDGAGDGEDRQVHGDEEAADHAAQEHHHQRLDHGGERRRRRRPPRRRRSRRSC